MEAKHKNYYSKHSSSAECIFRGSGAFGVWRWTKVMLYGTDEDQGMRLWKLKVNKY